MEIKWAKVWKHAKSHMALCRGHRSDFWGNPLSKDICVESLQSVLSINTCRGGGTGLHREIRCGKSLSQPWGQLWSWNSQSFCVVPLGGAVHLMLTSTSHGYGLPWGRGHNLGVRLLSICRQKDQRGTKLREVSCQHFRQLADECLGPGRGV